MIIYSLKSELKKWQMNGDGVSQEGIQVMMIYRDACIRPHNAHTYIHTHTFTHVYMYILWWMMTGIIQTAQVPVYL